MIDVRRRRVSGLVWCSVAFLFAIAPAGYLYLATMPPLLWGLSYSGLFDASAWTWTTQQSDWPRPLPMVVVQWAHLVVWQLITIGPMLAALWVYHRIVYHAAFEQARSEGVDVDGAERP